MCKKINTSYMSAITKYDQEAMKLEHYRGLINIQFSKFAKLITLNMGRKQSKFYSKLKMKSKFIGKSNEIKKFHFCSGTGGSGPKMPLNGMSGCVLAYSFPLILSQQ